MNVKRTPSKKTVPVVFQMPSEMLDELRSGRTQKEEDFLSKVGELHSHLSTFESSFTRHRLSVQSELLSHRTISQNDRKDMDATTKELEEAFDVLWPKLGALENSISKAGKEGRTSLSKVDEKHTKAIEEQSNKILALSDTIEKRYQSALKRIHQQKNLVEVRTDEGETLLIKDEMKRLNGLIKDIGKYEYGSSLNIFSAGSPIGFVSQINFKSGFTVSLNNSGGIDVTSTASGGTAVYDEVVAGSGTAFTLANTPIVGTIRIYAKGQRLTPGAGNDYTISGAVITTASPFNAGDVLADYSH